MKELDVNENLPFLVIGHRGCASVAPENTLRGIKMAIDFGCPMIEIDVHLVEGRLVVIHDFTLDRTTSGTGLVADTSLDELRLLDAGLGQKVPFLEEVLDLCAGLSVVNIELKGEGTALAVAELLKGREDEVVISSFNWLALEQLRDAHSGLPIALLVDDKKLLGEAYALAEELGACAINPSLKILDTELVAKAHERDLLVCCFTVRSESDAKKVFKFGADACFADDPQMVMGLL